MAAITFRQACSYLRSFHQIAPPIHGSTHPIPTYCSLIDLKRVKGWVGLVGWPLADGLPTIMVTHQLQVEHRTLRTEKVRQPENDVLPLCHATNLMFSRRRYFTTTLSVFPVEWKWCTVVVSRQQTVCISFYFQTSRPRTLNITNSRRN